MDQRSGAFLFLFLFMPNFIDRQYSQENNQGSATNHYDGTQCFLPGAKKRSKCAGITQLQKIVFPL